MDRIGDDRGGRLVTDCGRRFLYNRGGRPIKRRSVLTDGRGHWRRRFEWAEAAYCMRCQRNAITVPHPTDLPHRRYCNDD